jgi:hypothetical protein
MFNTRHILLAWLAWLLLPWLLSASNISTIPPQVPTWHKYSLAKIANATGGCTNANGCWTVNGGTAVNAAAALTQDIVLFALPAQGSVDTPLRMKTRTACSGAATALITSLGDTASDTYFASGLTYDLTAAVSATNLSNVLPTALGADTSASTNITVTLTTTVNNVDQLATGCAVDFWVKWAILP